MTSFYESAVAITGENRIKTKEPLNRYTTFRIGGNADFIAEPEKPEQIAELKEKLAAAEEAKAAEKADKEAETAEEKEAEEAPTEEEA